MFILHVGRLREMGEIKESPTDRQLSPLILVRLKWHKGRWSSQSVCLSVIHFPSTDYSVFIPSVLLFVLKMYVYFIALIKRSELSPQLNYKTFANEAKASPSPPRETFNKAINAAVGLRFHLIAPLPENVHNKGSSSTECKAEEFRSRGRIWIQQKNKLWWFHESLEKTSWETRICTRNASLNEIWC